MKNFAFEGYTTTHGGKLKATQHDDTTNGKATLRIGDSMYCPRCKKASYIIDGDLFYLVYGKPAAFVGSTMTCGAKILQSPEPMYSGRGYEPTPSRNNPFDNRLGQAYLNRQDNLKYDEKVRLLDKETGNYLADVNYYFVDPITKRIVLKGKTDADGYTDRVKTIIGKELDIFIGSPKK